MSEEHDFGDLMQSIAEKSLALLGVYKKNPGHIQDYIKQYIDVTHDLQALLNVLIQNPDKVMQMQLSYWQDAIGLMHDQFTHWLEGTVKPIPDKRFSAQEWVQNPFFNLLSQHYLLASEHLNLMLENIDYGDKRLAHRIQFFTRQYLDALSPANFLHTNPQLMAQTLQSHGKNLLLGLQNLLTDLNQGSSRLLIKMTDSDAFTLGKNLAITPGKVIFRNEMMELIQYAPQTETVYKIPLLMIPPWINKYYILDLSPNNSMVRWLVEQGITVFMISWVNPDASYKNKGLYDYMNEGPLTAIELIKKQMNVSKVNTLGFCIGGTLLACLLAYCKATNQDPVNSATFLASMIDFSDPGDMAVFIDEHQIARLEEEMKLKGYLDGRFMASTFNSLRANDLVWSFFIKNYLQGQNPVPFDILYWNADATNMPAKMHSTYLRWMYLHNYLIEPHRVSLDHVSIDVTQLTTPTFFVSTIKDHIAPWKTTYKGFEVMKGKKRFLLAGSGHIAGIINPPCAGKYNYYINRSTTQTADTWLSQAKEKPGSWWPEWCDWLKKLSGREVPAVLLNSLPFPGIMDAPGEYVLKTYKSDKT